MQTLESLKSLGIMIPQSKHSRFKSACASNEKDMKEVIESFVDCYIDNPQIMSLLKDGCK